MKTSPLSACWLRGLAFVAAVIGGLTMMRGPADAATLTVTNFSPISIPTVGNATPYPSFVTVSNLSGVVTKVTVTLRQFAHVWPDDVDVVLVGPSGQAVALLSDAGGSSSVTNLTLTFEDNATTLLPNGTVITSGTNRPSDYAPTDSFPGVTPPYTNVLSVFNGTDPNGSWLLYVLDDEIPDGGGINGGWMLSIEYAPALTDLPRQDFWVPDGPVYAMAQQGNTLYLGGNFNYLRPNRSPGVAFDTDTLQPDLTFPEVNGEIHAVARDGGGGFYLGGEFTMAGGVAVSNLAYVGPDRQVIAEWQAQVNGPVRALAFAGGRLFVGGEFTMAGGQFSPYLVAFNGATAELTNLSFTVDAPVKALGISLHTLFASGSFTNANGQLRRGFAAFDVFTGDLLPWNPNPLGGGVNAFVVNGDTVHAGGTFTNIGGQPRHKLAALDVHTGAAVPWPAGADSSATSVNALALAGGVLYVGGDFTQLYGAPRRALAAVDALSGTNTGWNPGLSNGVVNALVATTRSIFAGGSFSNVGAQIRRGLAAIDPATGLVRAWSVEPSGEVRGLALSFHTVFASGAVLNNGGVARRNAAAIDLNTGLPTAWNPDVNGTVLALLANGTNIVLGGGFSRVGGLGRTNLALVSSSTGSVVPAWSPSPNSLVFTLARSRNGPGHVLAGGAFTSISGLARSRLAEIDGSGLVTFWSADANGTVLALTAVSTNALYAGGVFSTIGGVPRAGLAALDPFTGAVTPWNAAGNGVIYTLAEAGGLLYVGGSFNQIGGAGRTNLAALGGSGLAAPWNPGANASVQSLTLRGDAVYVSGGFTRVAGQGRTNLAAISTATGALLAWNPSANSAVNVLATAGDLLLAGGDFTRSGTQYQSRLAAFPPEGTATVDPDPVHPRAVPGTNVVFGANVTGTPPLSYQWRYNGLDLPGATSPLFVLSNAQPFNSGAYSVVVSNPFGAVWGRERFLTVLEAPVILVQSSNVTAAAGSNLTLSVTASGNAPLQYSWRLNGDVIPGGVGPTFTIFNAQPTNSGEYSVFVFNDAGLTRSSNTLVAITAPSHAFANSFASRTALPGGASGVAQGNNTGATSQTNDPVYPGRLGGKSVWASWTAPSTGLATFSTRGSSFDTLLGIYTGTTLSNLVPVAFDDDAGGYWNSELRFNARANTNYVILIDGTSGQSGNIVLDWNLTPGAPVIPIILAPPQSLAVAQGANTNLSVTASAEVPGALRHQWFYEDRSIPGATNASLFIASAHARNVGAYTVRITNAAGGFTQNQPARVGVGAGLLGVDKIEDLTVGGGEIVGLGAAGAGLKAKSFTPAMVTPPVLGTNNTFASALLTAGHVSSSDPNPCQRVLYSSIHYGPFSVNDDAIVTVNTVNATVRTVLAAYGGVRVISGGVTSYSYFRDQLACDKSTGVTDLSQSVTFYAAPGGGNVYTVLADGLNGEEVNLQLNVSILTRRPVIIEAPISTVTTQGMSAEFRVVAGGNGPFNYRWLSNGLDIVGATLDRLVLQNVTPNFATAAFAVRVSNTFSSTTSPPVSVSVLVPPSVTLGPPTLHANRGGSATFTASVQGSPSPALSWFFTPVGGTEEPVSGQSGNTLIRSPVVDTHAGTYRVQAVNGAGVASATATMFVGSAPQFILQPATHRVRLGTEVVFSAVASGDEPIEYRWRKNPDTIVQEWTVNGSNHVISSASVLHKGDYQVEAKNAFGMTSSAEASLVVAHPILLTYRVSHSTNGIGENAEIFDWLELIIMTTESGVTNSFVLEATDQPTNLVWETFLTNPPPAVTPWQPIFTNTQPINPFVITQQMNLPARPRQFYRVNPPPP